MRIFVSVLVVGSVAVGVLCAQQPAFDVATVKVNRSGDGSTGFTGVRDGMVTARNASLTKGADSGCI